MHIDSLYQLPHLSTSVPFARSRQYIDFFIIIYKQIIWSGDSNLTPLCIPNLEVTSVLCLALLQNCSVNSGFACEQLYYSFPLCPDTKATGANEAEAGGNKAAHWQPEGRRAKLHTIIADAEPIRQKKQLDQVEKQTERGTETVRLGEKEMWRRRRQLLGVRWGWCFGELTGYTGCYKDERHQKSGSAPSSLNPEPASPTEA